MDTVIIYTQPSCGPCFATKRALDRAGVQYTEINLANDPEAREYVKHQLGYMSAPVVVTADEHWTGFQPDKLASLS